MADANVIDIVARFIIDETSRKGLDKAISGVGVGAGTSAGVSAIAPSADFAETYKAVSQYAKDFQVSTEDAARSLAGMASVGQKTEQQILADVEAFQRMGSEADKTSAAIQKTADNTSELSKNVRSISLLAVGEAINRLGNELRRAGKYLDQPILSFTKTAGFTDGASAQYLSAQKQIEAATVRVGAVMTREIAPTMQFVAGLASQVASFVEANPWIAKAAVGLAGIASVAGVMATVAGNVVLAAAAFGKIAAGLNMVKAALALSGSTSAAASAAGAGTTAIAGTAIGGLVTAALPYILVTTVIAAIAAAVYSFISGTELGKSRNMAAAPAQALVIGQYAIGTVLDKIFGTNKTPAAVQALSNALGLLGDRAGQAATQVKDASGNIVPQAAVDAFITYQQQETQAAQQYEAQRLQIVNDYGKQRAAAEASYENQRAEIIANYKQSLADDAAAYAKQTTTAARSYYQQEAQSEQDYYKSRSKAAKSYSIEVQRGEEDHQRAMLRMQEEHNQKVSDLLDKNDAFGLLAESRSYNKSRTDAEDAYAVETRRRSEDYANRIVEMEAQFAEERARRAAEYAQQRADAQAEYAARDAQRAKQMEDQLKKLDVQHKAEMVRLDQDQTDKLTQLQKQYNEERTARYNAFGAQLRDLNAFMGQETTLRQQYYDAWTAQYKAFMAANSINLQGKTYAIPGHASGGYTSGIVNTGEKGYEYILTHDTTKLLEKLAGSKLSQSKVTALLSGGAGGQSVTYNDNRRIDGRVTAADRRDLRNDQLQVLMGALA